MDYKEKIREYRERIKNKETLKFVDFLETVFEWIDTLYEKKRLREKAAAAAAAAAETFANLDKVSPTELSVKQYNALKRILLQEASELINHIINISDLRMTDFDLLQFNLYAIFGKEELATMVEWAREHLGIVILERKEKELKEKEEKKKAEEEYLRKIKAMSPEELKSLIVETTFDFRPRARTAEERAAAWENNRQKYIEQRKKMENFQRKLRDATKEEGAKAQTRVFRQIGKNKKQVQESRNKFRKKAKEIVSPEGPKKKIKEAQKMMRESRKRVGEEVEEARRNVRIKRKELVIAEEETREYIKESGKLQVKRGEHFIERVREHLEEEKEDTEKMFASAREHLAKGREHLEKERESFAQRRGKEEQRLAGIKGGLLLKGKGVSEGAESKFTEAREKIKGAGKGVKERAKNKVREAGEGVRERVERRKGKMGERTLPGKPAKVSLPEKESIQKGFLLKKEKLEKDLQRKKELLAYDVRFKQYSLQEKAKKQKEMMAEKFEAFQEKQQTMIARHRAGRKAHVIRTLLRAIRTMK